MKERNHAARLAAVLVLVCGAIEAQDTPRSIEDVRREFEARMAEMQARITELERLAIDTADRLPGRPIESYSGDPMHFGGHVTTIFTHLEGEDARDTGYFVSTVELFVKARLGDGFSVFATPGAAHVSMPTLVNPRAPELSPRIDSDVTPFLMRAFAEWNGCDEFNLKAGVIGTPHGVISREYFAPTRIVFVPNLHSRFFGGNLLYPQRVVGIEAFGRADVGSAGDAVEYSGYVGSELEDSGDPEYGVRVAFREADLGLSVAGNWGGGRRRPFSEITQLPAMFNFPGLFSPFPLYSNTRNSYQFVGIDVDLRNDDLVWKNEVYYSVESDGIDDKKGFYTQPTWFVSAKWALSYRFDYFAPGAGLGIAREHVAGISYYPIPYVHVSLDSHFQDMPRTDDDLQFFNFSVSASF